MNNGSRKRDKGKKLLSALQRLDTIEPIPPKFQFAIRWDSRAKILRFGCGHSENAVFVTSNRKVETAVGADGYAPKLRPACVKAFLGRYTSVAGRRLLRQCVEQLRSYLHLQDERQYSLLAVWSIATYVYPLFSHFGYLFFHSRFPRSGKTRVEEILSHLCFEATAPLNAPTVPTIRDTAAEGHTLILDTLERWKGKSPEAYSAAMELLDAGFRKGGTVMKMVSAGDGKWKRESFPVYAPYILAAIERESLTDTALDRAFAIEMHRKSITVKKRKYDFDRCERECLPLRDEFYLWALENARELAETYASCELEAEVDALELNDRAADIWKPLLAVARVLGSREVWQALTSLAVEMCRDPEAAERERIRGIVRSLRKLVNGTGAAVGITSEFVAHLCAQGLEVQERELHDMLAQWGFSQESVRLDQGPRRAWVLQDIKFAEIERENGPISPS